MVRHWQVSAPSALAPEQELTAADVPRDAAWQSLEAERLGLVNLSRLFGGPAGRPVGVVEDDD